MALLEPGAGGEAAGRPGRGLGRRPEVPVSAARRNQHVAWAIGRAIGPLESLLSMAMDHNCANVFSRQVQC